MLFIVFLKPTKKIQLTEHSSRQSGDYLSGLILVVNILLWSNTVFIITRHGLHGNQCHIHIQELLFPPTVWVCKTPLQGWPSQLHTQWWQVLCISKFLIIYLKFCFGCFDFIYTNIIFRLTVQPRWHLTNFLFQKVFWKVHYHRKNKLCAKAYQHQRYQLAYYKATWCP